MKTLLICVVLATAADGAELHFKVSDGTPVPLMPNVRHMSQAEFRAWAAQRNKDEYAKAAQRHERYLATRGPLKTAVVTEGSQSTSSRFGGGNGYGGYGGNGGYSGYNNNVSSMGVGGLGYGFGFQGNAMQHGSTYSSRSYSVEYPDLNDDGGGPITLINPHCYDYWSKHTGEETP